MSNIGDVPLTIRVGDTESVTVRIKDKTTGNPINVTGRTYASQIRREPLNSTVLASWSIDTTNAATGVLIMTLDKTVTATLPPGNATYDLQETNGTKVTSIFGGIITIVSDVTRIS